MAASYKDAINVVPHDFATTTTKASHNGNDIVFDGIEMLEVDRNADRFKTNSVGDGFAWFEKDPDQTGIIKVQVAEASPTTDKLWDVYEDEGAFSFSSSDSNSDKYKVNNALCQIAKAPTVKRGKEGDVVEWTFVCTYLQARGGSYRLVSI